MESEEAYSSNSNSSPAEVCRLLGEEKEEDAIWAIYLKKVRYQRPSAIVQIVQASGGHPLPSRSTRLANGYGFNGSGGGDDGGEITHLMWESIRLRVLRAGSLRRIIEAIENDDTDIQATHLSVFLATYRAFSTPAEVVSQIIDIYRAAKTQSNCEELQKAMLDTLNVWLDSYGEDFERGTDGHEVMSKSIMNFAVEENLKSLCLKIQYKLRARRRMKKSASLHSLTVSPLQIKTYSLLTIPENHFAQQLTYIDKEVFLNLRVWECLGGLWKRRNGCPTVAKSISQFNALSGRVVSTLLLDPNATLSQRAKYLDKWIRISQHLRQLKNFSSLKAIISGLESNPVFRLSSMWHLLSKERLSIFSQLSQIFSEENNRLAQRNLLSTEGTAKYPSPATPPKPPSLFSRMRGRSSTGSSSSTAEETPPPIGTGTIPYLGTFLTDLTFIDTAIPDLISDLHNFEKRKKEFEILAQLKLLQSSAKGYRVDEDPYFSTWFNSLLVLDEKAAYEASLMIQPERIHSKGHRKNDSYTSNSSSEAEGSSPRVRKGRAGSIPSSNGSNSISSLSTPSAGMRTAHSSSNLAPHPETALVVKVSTPSVGEIMYKSIMIGNADKTPQVLKAALEKLSLEDEDPRNYNLVQVLPNKELQFPSNANIYYALDTASCEPANIRLEVRPNGANNNWGVKKNSILNKSTRSN